MGASTGKKTLWGIGGLLLLAPTLPSLSQPPGSIRHVNNTDSTRQGHTPCQATIATALAAVQPGETIRIQAGSYREQLTLSGFNNTLTAIEANWIIIEADPTASPGSVVLRGAGSICTNRYAIRL